MANKRVQATLYSAPDPRRYANLFALWQRVGLSILILTLVAVVWSRLVSGMVHYPTKWFDKSPPSIFWGGWSE